MSIASTYSDEDSSLIRVNTGAMLEVTTSSLYAKVTVVFVGVTLFFHVLGVATDDWCHVTTHGQRYVLGLWRECFQTAPRRWSCSHSHSAIGFTERNWGVGPQVLMVLSLILLILTQGVVLSYTCVGKFIMYRLKLAEITIGLSLTAGFLTLIGLILFGNEISKYPEEYTARVAWSFGMCVLSMLFSLATSGFVLLDRKLETYTASLPLDSVSLDLQMDHDVENRYLIDWLKK